MYNINEISNDSIIEAKKFLESVPSIKNVENSILKNAIVVKDEETNTIVGTISYEDYEQYGLIRYFVFKKVLVDEIITQMFENLIVKAKASGIKYFISIVNDSVVESLFKELQFEEVDGEDVFIDEECFLDTKNKDSKILIRKNI